MVAAGGTLDVQSTAVSPFGGVTNLVLEGKLLATTATGAGLSQEKVAEFERDFLLRLETLAPDLMEGLRQGKLDEEGMKTIEQTARETACKYEVS